MAEFFSQRLSRTAGRLRRRFRRLGSDERGAVFVYGAVIIFIALTFFGMTFDSMRYIEKKMISQNAADAAALEMAAWQARGLNVVQEINSDIYQIDTVIWETMNIMYTVAAIVVDAEALAGLSLNFPLLAKIDKARRNIDKICGPILTTFKMVRTIPVKMLIGLREVYVYGSNAAGFLGAIEAATANGASPVLTSSLVSKLPAGFSKPAGKLTAIGMPLKLSNPFKLPVEKKQDKGSVFGGSSLNSKDNIFWKYKVFRIKALGSKSRKALKGDWSSWKDPYYQAESISTKAPYPYPAWVWIACAEVKPAFLMDTFFWGVKMGKAPIPYSYAIGQPIGGNVVRFTNQTNRKPGLGAGIEPALVPVSELKNWNSTLTSLLEQFLFMH